MRRMRVLDPGLLLARDNWWELSFCDVATVSLGLFSGRVFFLFLYMGFDLVFTWHIPDRSKIKFALWLLRLTVVAFFLFNCICSRYGKVFLGVDIGELPDFPMLSVVHRSVRKFGIVDLSCSATS